MDYEQEPKAWRRGALSILEDYRFHAQNVYALIMKTLARFEFALGRRIGWSFGAHQLNVAPHAMVDANAFYSPGDQGLVFGYFAGSGGKPVYTSLSHDVVVHETTHALVDAIREKYMAPSSPDQAAFHEGYSDVIALLSVFSQRELVEELLCEKDDRARKSRTLAPDAVKPAALKKSALLGLAEEMGEEIQNARGNALRRSVEIEPDRGILERPEFDEPHRRGEVFSAAVLNAFVRVWTGRIVGTSRGDGLGTLADGRYSLRRVAEEGAAVADYLATMLIRALDYMPPVHVTFRDVLSAMLTADVEIRPDDSRYMLRARLIEQFAAYGIAPASDRKDIPGIWHAPRGALSYERVRFESMRSDPDEVFRFLWENRSALGLREEAYTRVLSVRPCVRVGIDGFTLRETVAEYYQVANLTLEELRSFRIAVPRALAALLDSDKDTPGAKAVPAEGDGDVAPENGEGDADASTVALQGGGTLIFDEYGRLKYHVSNDVLHRKRQSERLADLVRFGYFRAPRGGRGAADDRRTGLRDDAPAAQPRPDADAAGRLVTMAKAPQSVTIRSYQVGFGDCFLLQFIYAAGETRNVLIDFGTTAIPKALDTTAASHMLRVAERIAEHCGRDLANGRKGKLHAVVATHRHQDHISGFATDSDGKGSGSIIKDLLPDVVVQPWTEDPDAGESAERATSTVQKAAKSIARYRSSLAAMHGVAEAAVAFAKAELAKGSAAAMSPRSLAKLQFVGEDNVSNLSAVRNLIAMGSRKGATRVYANYGSTSGLQRVLPGVKVTVLGPPTLEQTKGIKTMTAKDENEFWHLLAGSQHARGALPLARGLAGKLPKRGTRAGHDSLALPPQARWFARRLAALRATEVLEIVTALDDEMNNTSLILLFEFGGRKLLFPGDAQLENWRYALKEVGKVEAARNVARLADIDLYKVGHHGSLNATPKQMLWAHLSRRKAAGSSRLRTMMSTMPGKHPGKAGGGGEVPRKPLVEALQAETILVNTDTFRKSKDPAKVEWFQQVTIEALK
jgi:hypothetical protein